MAPLFLVAGFLCAALLTAAMIPIFRRLAFQRDWVDRPDGGRKLHAEPVPTVGGIAIAGGFAAGLLAASVLTNHLPFTLSVPPAAFWIGAVIAVGAGFYDDVRGLGFKHKFAIQIAVAFILIHAGYRVDLEDLLYAGADPYNAALYSIALTMLWIVGVMNAVNLIDGLDGLAGGVVLIAFASLGLVFGLQGDLGLVAIAMIMVGSVSAFLAFNFNPASVFMGDSGSLFLGYVLAAFSLQGQAHPDPLISLLVPVMVLGLPLLDTNLSILRRYLKGHSICAPDNDHIHHRLQRRWATRPTVLILYAAAACFGLIAILMVMSSRPVALGLLGIAFLAVFAGVSTLGYESKRIFTVIPRLLLTRGDLVADLPWPFNSDRREHDAAGQYEPAVGSAVERAGDGMSGPNPPEVNVGSFSAHRDDRVSLAADMRQDEETEARARNLPPSSVSERNDRNRDSLSTFVLKSTMMAINKDDHVVANKEVTSADLGGEAVLLNAREGLYFGLNEVGVKVWSLIQQPRTVESVIDSLSEEFDASRDILRQDVDDFLSQMKEHRLIRALAFEPAG